MAENFGKSEEQEFEGGLIYSENKGNSNYWKLDHRKGSDRLNCEIRGIIRRHLIKNVKLLRAM